MTPLQADQPVPITLQAQQWNVVLGALSDAPWRIADPMIREITRQLEAAASIDAIAAPAPALANGHDHANAPP